MSLITNYENLPINLLIKNLCDAKGSDIDFDDLKTELTKKTENFEYYLSIKEDADLCMLYYNNVPEDLNRDLENSCRSVILDKKTLKPIVTQFNKILYNRLFKI